MSDLYDRISIFVPEPLIFDPVRPLVVLVAGDSQAGFCPRRVIDSQGRYWRMGSGPVEKCMAVLLRDADAMHAACVEAGAPVTLAQCDALLSACIVDPRTGDDLPALLAEHGMQYAPEPEA